MPIVEADVLGWFTGKGREKAAWALARLAESEARGEWVSKASRTVRAIMVGKANVASRLGGKHRRELEAIGDYTVPMERRGWSVGHLLVYGGSNPGIDFAAIREAAPEALKGVITTAERFAADMAPVKALMAKLDATRPEPVFTYLGCSPTVTATLTYLGVEGNTETTRPCPIEWKEEVRKDKNGTTFYVKVGYLKWPEGTVHGTSRYDRHSNHCESCGHAIKNGLNWVPLVIDNKVGVPHSLWVGRDCARTIFGIKVDGEMELTNGHG
jgi:hypothetical protein